MGDAEGIREEMKKNHNEVKENLKILTDMISNLVIKQTQALEETSTRLDTLEGTNKDIVKRLEKIEEKKRAQYKLNTHTESYM